MDKIIILLLLALYSCFSFADDSHRFERVTCVPEANFLLFEEIQIRELDNYIYKYNREADKAIANGDGISVFKKHDIFIPDNLNFNCSLANNIVHIELNVPPSGARHCQYDPAPILSLTLNNSPIVMGARINENCWGIPSITKFSIYPGRQGNYSGYLYLCAKQKYGDKERCGTIELTKLIKNPIKNDIGVEETLEKLYW